MTMLVRTSGLSRLSRLSCPTRSIRYNSTHNHPESHQTPTQGDGTVRISLQSVSILTIALMSRGIVKASIYVGVLYIVYLYDRSIAKNNGGRGPVYNFFDWLVADGKDPQLMFAGMEEQRQNTKSHYEQGQRPIYRVNYPEYVWWQTDGY
jgi:hypothetical protein